jgi:hypothetical protein
MFMANWRKDPNTEEKLLELSANDLTVDELGLIAQAVSVIQANKRRKRIPLNSKQCCMGMIGQLIGAKLISQKCYSTGTDDLSVIGNDAGDDHTWAIDCTHENGWRIQIKTAASREPEQDAHLFVNHPQPDIIYVLMRWYKRGALDPAMKKEKWFYIRGWCWGSELEPTLDMQCVFHTMHKLHETKLRSAKSLFEQLAKQQDPNQVGSAL